MKASGIVALTAIVMSATAQPGSAQSAITSARTEAACREGQSPIMILGMYHMANPGLDAVNTEADDVLLPRRQKEIQDLVERLARFRPTKIAVEAPYRSTTVPDRYKHYVADTYELTRDETEQIGFRLAKRLGLPGVTPIDFPMFMSGLVYSELDLTPKPDTVKPVAAAPSKPRELSPAEKLMRASTVTQYLAHVNADSMVKKDHAGYLDMIKGREMPAIYEKTDYLTNWYKRNLRMFTNLNREVEPGKDRVVVLVGSGHITILRQLADAASYYCVVDPAAYLN
jgi:hypothetical protein